MKLWIPFPTQSNLPPTDPYPPHRQPSTYPAPRWALSSPLFYYRLFSVLLINFTHLHTPTPTHQLPLLETKMPIKVIFCLGIVTKLNNDCIACVITKFTAIPTTPQSTITKGKTRKKTDLKAFPTGQLNGCSITESDTAGLLDNAYWSRSLNHSGTSVISHLETRHEQALGHILLISGVDAENNNNMQCGTRAKVIMKVL